MGPFEFNGVQYVNKQERDLLIVAGWLDFLSIDNSEIGTVRNRDTNPPHTLRFAKKIRTFRKKLQIHTGQDNALSLVADFHELDTFAQNWTSECV